MLVYDVIGIVFVHFTFALAFKGVALIDDVTSTLFIYYLEQHCSNEKLTYVLDFNNVVYIHG